MASESMMMNVPEDDLRLVERARVGDEAAAGEALLRYRDRLPRTVDARFDPRVRDRVDPSDFF